MILVENVKVCFHKPRETGELIEITFAMKPIARITLCLALLLFAGTGCKSVSYTSQFYQPTTTQTYPPKPKSYKIPILDTPPDHPYEIIGRLSFSASHGHDFMIKAVEYNARRAGADAAIMLGSASLE